MLVIESSGRFRLRHYRIGRVLFFIHGGQMVLLHGFIKKTHQTPDQDLDLAVKRKKEIENDGKTKE